MFVSFVVEMVEEPEEGRVRVKVFCVCLSVKSRLLHF